ncbi:MAG: hypothetical protein O7I42_13940 [Alphaproteobacteria bacterium]|nr:hypothetical protein [Alphaproteobacteria bacterium]
MKSKDPSRYSAPFDDMLADSSNRFDKLLRGGAVDDRRQRVDQRPPAPARTTKEMPPPHPASSTPGRAQARAYNARSSELGRSLNARFGDDWRYEIADQRRDGDEVVVWGRLIVEDQGVDKTRRARARIRWPAESGNIKGSADGADFSLRQGNDVPVQPDGDPEEAAFGEAAEAALAICIKGVLTR